MRVSLPFVLQVEEAVPENAETVTLYFARPDDEEAEARGLELRGFTPGQFFMVWLPRVDEKPYAISHLDAERLAITVQKRGPFSTRLCELQPGAGVGLRGPFGRGFWGVEARAESTRVALIGGGCGMAVLAPLAERLPKATLVQGARSADRLFYLDRFPEQVVFTDDGSAGRQGFPTDWLKERIAEGVLDAVYACGPEVMLASVVEVCRGGGVACQASLERYMKCGFGVCGQCDCDGRRVCVEGPVFDADELARMPSFGRLHRDGTGRAVPVTADGRCPADSTEPPV